MLTRYLLKYSTLPINLTSFAFLPRVFCKFYQIVILLRYIYMYIWIKHDYVIWACLVTSLNLEKQLLKEAHFSSDVVYIIVGCIRRKYRDKTRGRKWRDFEIRLVFRTWWAFRLRESRHVTLKDSSRNKKNIKGETMRNQRVSTSWQVFIFRTTVDSRQRLPALHSTNRVTLRVCEVNSTNPRTRISPLRLRRLTYWEITLKSTAVKWFQTNSQ